MNTGTKQSKQVMVKIADLIIDVFVREKTDPEYVFHLATLYEAGVEMDPIEITLSKHVIEGRHRIEAANLVGRTEINAIIGPDRQRKDMIADAMIANLGGKRAPTREDILIAIEAMLRSGASERWVRERIPFPAEVMKVYMADVKSRIQKKKIAEAKVLLTEGLTIDQAADKVGIPMQTIQDALVTRPRKEVSLQQFKGSMVVRNRRAGQSNRQVFDAAMKAFLDGEATKDEVFEVIASVENHGRLSVKAAEDFRLRFMQRIS